jgi:hypothetical protein
MSDPILSPRFGKKDGEHFNIIQTLDRPIDDVENYTLRNNFYLCVLRTKEAHQDEKFIIKDLEVAKNDVSFWELLKNGFNKDYQFLQSLMEFLPTLDASFKVGFLMDGDTPYACTVVGHTKDEAIILSGVIKDDYRGKKKSRNLKVLVNQMVITQNINKYFFWTMSEKLINYADQVDRYLIYTKKQTTEKQ